MVLGGDRVIEAVYPIAASPGGRPACPSAVGAHLPAAEANPSGMTGVSQGFKNPDGSRTIVDLITINPDPPSAITLLGGMANEYGKKVNAPSQPIDVGSSGFMVIGQAKEPTSPKEISAAVFTQGRALVDLEIDCVPGNPTPADVLLDLARNQDAAIESGLPS